MMNGIKIILPVFFSLLLAQPIVAKSNAVQVKSKTTNNVKMPVKASAGNTAKAPESKPVKTVESVCSSIQFPDIKKVCMEYCDTPELAETCINFSKDTYKQSLCFRNAKNIEYAKACRALTNDDFRAANCLSLAKSVEHVKACTDLDKDPVVIDHCMSQVDDAKQVLKCKERVGNGNQNEKINCLTIVRYEVDVPAENQVK